MKYLEAAQTNLSVMVISKQNLLSIESAARLVQEASTIVSGVRFYNTTSSSLHNASPDSTKETGRVLSHLKSMILCLRYLT